MQLGGVQGLPTPKKAANYKHYPRLSGGYERS
jgi:hypothetical protein